MRRLDNCYDFKLQCEKSDQKLRTDYLNHFNNLQAELNNDIIDIKENIGIVLEDIKNDDSAHSSETEYTKGNDNNKDNELKTSRSSRKTINVNNTSKKIKTPRLRKTEIKTVTVTKTRGRKKLLDESLLNVDDSILETKFLETKLLEDMKKRELKAQKRKERREREKSLRSENSEQANTNESKSKTNAKGKTKAQILQEEKEKRLLLRKSKLNINNITCYGNNQCYTCGKIVSSR